MGARLIRRIRVGRRVPDSSLPGDKFGDKFYLILCLGAVQRTGCYWGISGKKTGRCYEQVAIRHRLLLVVPVF